MVKFPEAQARLYKNIFVCSKCSTKIRTSNVKVKAGKVTCRRCNSKQLRAVRKK